ncbi:hypothetical protein C8F01DRAFT_1262517 [Mycena amicta]|nr:hypothetical protein C8F01DRAFT_1262517 [Mycena amicta]
MPRRTRSPSSSPDSPERRPLTDASNLIQDWSPTNSPRSQRALRAKLQAALNSAATAQAAKDQQIADLQHQASTTRKPRKRRRFHRDEDAPQGSVDDPTELATLVTTAGRRFALVCGIFFVDINKVGTTPLDDSFDPATEYDNKANKVQGQIRDVLDVLPEEAKSKRTEPWIWHAFIDGVEAQRTLMRNRVRKQSLCYFTDDRSQFETADSRFKAFSELIGYCPATDERDAHYSPFKAEVLYDQFDGTVNLDHLFRGPDLLKVYAACLRGADGPDHLFDGDHDADKERPQARTNEKIYRIKHTTPGAIATCAVLTIFLYSADPNLVEEGHVTNIVYRKRYITYVSKIRLALLKNHAWARDLLRYWDGILFPNSDESFGDRPLVGDQRAEEEEMEEDQDVFDNAPVAADSAPSRSPSPTPPPPQQQRPPTPPATANRGRPTAATRTIH